MTRPRGNRWLWLVAAGCVTGGALIGCAGDADDAPPASTSGTSGSSGAGGGSGAAGHAGSLEPGMQGPAAGGRGGAGRAGGSGGADAEPDEGLDAGRDAGATDALDAGGAGVTRGVTVEGNRLQVDGRPFSIRGVCWNPVAKGGVHPADLDFAGFVEGDAALMQAAGINAVRTYEPITDTAVLDALHAAGIYVLNMAYAWGGDPPSVVDARVTAVKDLPDALRARAISQNE